MSDEAERARARRDLVYRETFRDPAIGARCLDDLAAWAPDVAREIRRRMAQSDVDTHRTRLLLRGGVTRAAGEA